MVKKRLAMMSIGVRKNNGPTLKQKVLAALTRELIQAEDEFADAESDHSRHGTVESGYFRERMEGRLEGLRDALTIIQTERGKDG